MNVFADTNFLISLYFKRGGDLAQNTLLGHCTSEGPVWISQLVVLETINAIERLVFKSDSGDPMRVSSQIAAVVQKTFSDDLSDGVLIQEMPIAATDLKNQFTHLALRHTAKHGFRAYDMLHISSAIILGCDAVWSFDQKANTLARMEGLATL